ncbi:transposase [Mucilaginibacter galii]|uniref:IS110 family transposase n=1 Tax=Mucilaginibacter galii TaxID=2005073 RepID=A0A917N268_9SPHI|nr:transposase [Mucilaginibacter galii]GGI51588.1 IS110 family transposase [Mucilaginibacter galii]
MDIAKKYSYFIGIDVSRDKLDCAVMNGRKLVSHTVIPNELKAIRSFLKDIKQLPKFTIGKSLFGLEQTGIYTSHLLNALKRFKGNVVLEDALHIKSSLGKMRGKYDKLDAIRIATFLYKTKEEARLWAQRRPIIDKLAHLSSLRFRLIGLSHAIRIPLKEQTGFLDPAIVTTMTSLCSNSMLALKNDIDEVDKAIISTVKEDERTKRLFEIITSVPSVGPVTAVQIIITTNEYKDITDPKKYASYAGVAPFRDESGIVVGKAKISSLANKRVKTLLHICAISSISYQSDFKAYYQRKTKDEGKSKMSVLNAVRYKIILRIFACLNQDRVYQKEYVRASARQVEPTG